MISMCPKCVKGTMTLVNGNYVCDCCCFSRPVVAPGAVLQYRLFDENPLRIPSKGKKRLTVGQKVADVPARSESSEKWEELPGVIME